MSLDWRNWPCVAHLAHLPWWVTAGDKPQEIPMRPYAPGDDPQADEDQHVKNVKTKSGAK